MPIFHGFEITKIRAAWKTKCMICQKWVWPANTVKPLGDAILPVRVRDKEAPAWCHATCVLREGIYEPTGKKPIRGE